MKNKKSALAKARLLASPPGWTVSTYTLLETNKRRLAKFITGAAAIDGMKVEWRPDNLKGHPMLRAWISGGGWNLSCRTVNNAEMILAGIINAWIYIQRRRGGRA